MNCNIRIFSLTLPALALLIAQAAADPVTVIHSWTMGEEEGGIAGNAADSTLVDTVGDADLEPVGLPVFAALDGHMGVFFPNEGSAHNVGATEYFFSDEADINPTDPTKWGFEAIVRIDVLPATSQELAVMDVGGGSTGIILETFGNGAWAIHQSGVSITAAATPVLVGQKQHLAVVQNNGKWELYVDGLLATSFPSTGSDPNSGIRIGAGNAGPGNNRGFNGIIETVRVFEYTDTFDIYDTLLAVTNPDADGDGFDDDVETELGYNPNDPASTPESSSSLETAVEFTFHAAKGKSYTIQSSTDLKTWVPVEENITGSGNAVRRLYSIRGVPARHFRAVRQEL